MKLAIIALALASVLFSRSAGAEAYLSIDNKVRFTTLSVSQPDFTDKLAEQAFTGAIAVGVRTLTPLPLRLEIAYDYYTPPNAISNLSVKSISNIDPGGGGVTTRDIYHYSYFSQATDNLIANLYWDIARLTPHDWFNSFIPYLGAGIGYHHIKWQNYQEDELGNSSKQSGEFYTPLYQLKLGCGYQISAHLMASLGANLVKYAPIKTSFIAETQTDRLVELRFSYLF